MEFWIKAAQLILSLSFLIVLHEFGHYIPARAFKTRIEKFYLFFDVKFALFKKKIKDTEWGIGWLPLGGYVKIAGMIDESMDTEQMKQPPQPWEFRTKPAWQRLIIMIGGIVVNLIVGIVIYACVLMAWGDDYIPVGGLPNGMVVHDEFKKFGFRDGDQILEVGDEVPFDVTSVNLEIFLRGARSVMVRHTDGSTETISLPEDIEWTMFEQDAVQAFTPRFYPIIDSVSGGSNAEKAGLLKADLLTSIDGDTIVFYDEFVRTIDLQKSKTFQLGVLRDGKWVSITATTDSLGIFGFQPQARDQLKPLIKTKSYTPFSAVPEGFRMGMDKLSDYSAQLKFLFSEKGVSSMGGFGAFGSMFPDAWDWQAWWLTTAFISLVLAFMNFLPIPALDGGHIMFLLFEMITRRKPSDKFLQYAQVVGFVLLMSLILYANGNDIYKAITGKW